MATRRPKDRYLEHIADSHGVRRSPRLSGRFPTSRDNGRSQLASYSVSSRPSLKNYGRGKKKEQPTITNILNESGQSVPASFDEEADGGAYDRREEPPHLFGLDESDNESSASSLPESTVDHEPSTVYTPIRRSHQPKGIFSRATSCLSSILYKCGSLIYLAATGVLCLDVIILHRFFNYGRPSQRGLCYYMFLPLILTAVVLFLIGGELIPGPASEPPGMEVVMRAVTNRVQSELNLFKTSFRSDIQNHIDDYINLTIQTSESKTNLTVKENLAQRDRVFAEYRETLLNQLNTLLTERTSALEARLRALQEAASNSSLPEASVRDIARETASEQVNSVKPEWLAESKQQLGSDITNTVDTLRGELVDILRNTEANLTEQLASLSEKASSLREDLQTTQYTLSGTTSDVGSIRTQLNTHESQIGALQGKQKEILDDITQFKTAALERISALESKSEEAINADQAVYIFYEELDKTLANESSALRQWLANHMISVDTLQEIEHLVNSVQRDAPPGNLTRSDVEEVVRMSLERYSADKTGKFDFALENSGGSVILDKCSPTFPQSLSTVTLFGLPLWRSCAAGSAKLIIQPQVYPGDCWALNGTSGYATIKLKDKILVTEVSVEHIPKQLSPNGTVDSAPKDFSVYGLRSVEDSEGTFLGRFTYDIDGSPIQLFEVQGSSTPYEIVKFSFENNHGNPAYTCVYRVRVHGRYPN